MASTTFRRVKRLVLLLNLCMIEFGTMSLAHDLIDKDHLDSYPYCGSMHYTGSEYTRSINRAVNAKEDYKKRYRWLVVLEINNMNRNGDLSTGTCTGSVLKER